MADIRPFICIRPSKEVAAQVAALPYDVYSRSEACTEVKGKPLSFLNIDRAETQFDDTVDTYDDRVYDKARELLDARIGDGTFVTDKDAAYYIYELTMEYEGNVRAQTGIVACASIDDYLDNMIKKHENTREDKEIDRIRHVDTCSAQTGPIFLAYRADRTLKDVVAAAKKSEPLYDFKSDDGIWHRVWKISAASDVKTIKETFEKMDSIYIADGHHRAASAVKVGLKRRGENPEYTGNEEFNYFLCVLFPDDELMIMPYNRVVRDLNGNTPDEFIAKIKKAYDVCESGKRGDAVKPSHKGTVGMYLDGKWYTLTAHKDILNDDPVDGLDVSLLQRYVLAPILGIDDPRTDRRIEFIGGIRGTAELERRADGDMKVAFSMNATSISELFDVADAGLLMPPKSTWFEPKLRSGLFIHRI